VLATVPRREFRYTPKPCVYPTAEFVRSVSVNVRPPEAKCREKLTRWIATTAAIACPHENGDTAALNANDWRAGTGSDDARGFRWINKRRFAIGATLHTSASEVISDTVALNVNDQLANVASAKAETSKLSTSPGEIPSHASPRSCDNAANQKTTRWTRYQLTNCFIKGYLHDPKNSIAMDCLAIYRTARTASKSIVWLCSSALMTSLRLGIWASNAR
jgi:hypothetical protein